MGLDMYLRGDKFYVQDFDARPLAEDKGKPTDADGDRIENSIHDLGYWRKFAPLHTYIVTEYAEGIDECQQIRLEAEHLKDIADTLRGNSLPDNEECHGFFFGAPEHWDEDRADAEKHAKMFEDAIKWLDAAPKYDNGNLKQWRSVFYQASW